MKRDQMVILRNPANEAVDRIEVTFSGKESVGKETGRMPVSVPSEPGMKNIVTPERVTVVKSPTTPTISIVEDALCDDILSCISALDEVIAEFDDSISQSSSSSLPSGTETPQNLSVTLPNPTSNFKDPHKLRGLETEPSSQELDPKVGIMQKEPETVTRIRVGGTEQSSPPKPHHADQRWNRPLSSAPVKPTRQSKKIYGNTDQNKRNQSSSYQIQPNQVRNSSNGNFTTYGIVFPKHTNSSPPSQEHSSNNNMSPTTGHSPVKFVLESTGAGNAFLKGESNRNSDTGRHVPKAPSASPPKEIPVTFVMKPEDLKRFLENEPEEDWNCHIEKNLPRSLRKTRKTCFIEDDEEEQQKYCRSPKDFRKNLGMSSDTKRSPLLNQRKPSLPLDGEKGTQWMRGEDVNAILSRESHIKPKAQMSPISRVNGTSGDKNNVSHGTTTSRNLNEEISNESRFYETLPLPPPNLNSEVSEIDDGYLSMINRHEAPLLWPEGGIESETFTPDELRRLSVSNINVLNGKSSKHGSISQAEDKTDYFSDDSLELDDDTDNCRKNGNIAKRADKMASFIFTSPTPSIVQPYINKSSTRKSWSPASEIRIPTKAVINTNTWRKGPLPPSELSLDENFENIRIQMQKASQRLRKPCAFFVPMNPREDDGNEKIKTNGKAESLAVTHNAVTEASVSAEDVIATRLATQALEVGVQEAACINALLDSPSGEDILQSELEKDLLSVNLNSVPHPLTSPVNSSLALSIEDKLSSIGSDPREQESPICSSRNDYETSSDGKAQNYNFLPEGDGYNILEEDKDSRNDDEVQAGSTAILISQRPEDIEDLYENPPPFIPPPPQDSSPAPIPQRPISCRAMETVVRKDSTARRSGTSEESDKDSFPEDIPSRGIAGERALRTQRQTSRSHENLLDIDRKEYLLPHPCVRRGHSATLPPNAVAPLSGRRTSALRQFFGFFRKKKKASVSSGLDLQDHLSTSPDQKELESSVCFETGLPNQPPEHFSPYRESRPSTAESHGSQRSNTSKTSNKRSVLSKIFRRKEK